MTKSIHNRKIYEILIRDTIIDLGGKLKEPCGVIPDICHFFTQAKFLEKKIHTEKRQFFALNL